MRGSRECGSTKTAGTAAKPPRSPPGTRRAGRTSSNFPDPSRNRIFSPSQPIHLCIHLQYVEVPRPQRHAAVLDVRVPATLLKARHRSAQQPLAAQVSRVCRPASASARARDPENELSAWSTEQSRPLPHQWGLLGATGTDFRPACGGSEWTSTVPLRSGSDPPGCARFRASVGVVRRAGAHWGGPRASALFDAHSTCAMRHRTAPGVVDRRAGAPEAGSIRH